METKEEEKKKLKGKMRSHKNENYYYLRRAHISIVYFEKCRPFDLET